MNIKNDVEELLKNIQKGLNQYTIKELNDAIVSFLNKKEDKSEEIIFILNLVAKEFKTNITTLKKKNVRGIISEAKQITYLLLHINLGLSTRYISDRIFNNWHSVVHKAITRFNNANIQLKPDRDFIEKYEKLSQLFIESFTTESKKLEYEH
jgi:chromosomal replication initiation ATPase DnaA